MKPGDRLRSAVCTTEVVVLRAGDGTGAIECGGVPMAGEAASNEVGDPAFMGGTLLGKRYGHAQLGIQVLCTKGGEGTLTIGGEPLQVEDATQLHPRTDQGVNVDDALEMAVLGHPDRVAITAAGRSVTYQELAVLAGAAAARFEARPAVIYIGTNHLAYAVCVFAAARLGIPFIPLNYRLSDEQLDHLLAAHPGAAIVHQESTRVPGSTAVQRNAFLASLDEHPVGSRVETDADTVAVVLYTSGTTAAPKAALLRHRHLMSYVMTTVEFGSAGQDEAALVSVPPYHIAGLTSVVTNTFSGRRIVYLDAFDPRTWLETVDSEHVTHAMVVPTMLARIVDELAADPDRGVPSLAALSYGGGRTPLPVLEKALSFFPSTAFTQAYGLTETSSTVAVLGPDEHRSSFRSDDPAVRARLGSVGRLVPGVEVEIRDDQGRPVTAGERGAIFLRGAQISGEYAGATRVESDGWFPTRDVGWMDSEGYLFIEGRADDTIIRGGENIAPAEIEDVLLAHPDVADAAVVGIPDEEWGQRIAAAVVLTEGARVGQGEIQAHVRGRLRSSKTPDLVVFRAELPRTDTGKLIRRRVAEDLAGRQP